MVQKTTVVTEPSVADLAGVALTPDTTERPVDTVKVIGLLWPDNQDGYLRVYFTTELDHYVRVARPDIVGSREMDPPEADFPRRIVWVKETATLQHTRVVPADGQKDFLNGELFADVAPHLESTAQSVAALQVFAAKDAMAARPGSVVICTPFFPPCPRPSAASECLCSFRPCSRGRDCCGSLGTCG